MKKTKIMYWAFTILFALFMGFTAIPDILAMEEAMAFISHLGYPEYFVPFIGVAKLLGCIAILIPNFLKVKEWAYAGLFFDLIGATYSTIATDGFLPQLFMMALPFGLGIVSYIFNHKYYKGVEELKMEIIDRHNFIVIEHASL